MTGNRQPRPEQARNATEFVALLRELKDHCGLSYRQLEERAERRGEVLARSTIADGLRKSALPRADVVAPFVRACGGGDVEVRSWLAVRDRLAAVPEAAEPNGTIGPNGTAGPKGTAESHSPGLTPTHGPTPAIGARRLLGRRPARWWLGAAGFALTLGLAALTPALWPSDERETEAGTGPLPGGWVQIRPVGARDQCLTEGREQSGRYRGPVAVPRPCTHAEPPRTQLRSTDAAGVYYIEWDHPQHGRGCLTLLDSGPAATMLEPWDDCSGARATQRFRIESAERPAGAYRIASTATGGCLAIGDEPAQGAEAVVGSCSDAEAQLFLITSANAPQDG
ncbi:RICIN domain-containing protein [Streptomyces marispadix]|uniref:RICIN domain-containing protein n=1 Tax=Streptomyces marispadix TaxID=2922868 RepID=A0ABS9SRI3_9ACTN|nr:RICIN domain-containing protein [Streptomyces marispadix]MCH6158890.1 RICIN domain-containing protein [Streptomyces marispadix]